MKNVLLILMCLLLFSCKETPNKKAFHFENLYAWCIVPFDSKERPPQERIQMLKTLGFKKYAYDWREKHLPEMAGEWKLAAENGVEVMAVWMWIDDNSDEVAKLSTSNEKLLKALQEAQLNTQIWVSFNANFFENLSDEEAVEKAAIMIDYLCKRAGSLGCKVALYNHGDWFGEPQNQIKIIQALPQYELG